MQEFDLLKHVYAANRSTHEPRVLIGPGDDMGMIALSLERAKTPRILAAVDQIVDGRHFRLSSASVDLIGRKAVTRSLSDIAAMAAEPLASLAAVVLPPDFGEQRAQMLFDSMHQTAQLFRCPLIGGDIAFHADPAHPLTCSVTVLAEPYLDRVLTRSGAEVGDVVCVTGPLGGSLQPDGLGRHLTFEPRIALAKQLSLELGSRLHAMIDISDGLGRDASHIAERSSVQMILDASRIPCNSNVGWIDALRDGEDYELCFTMQGEAPAAIGGHRIFEIGRVVPHPDSGAPRVLIRDGTHVLNADELGWQHASIVKAP